MDAPLLAVVGDCHGHLQLALSVAAQWQAELSCAFEAVFLCGDVGTFTEEKQLDSATRRHARVNPCELEFLTQWSTRPPAPWLEWIFRPLSEGGLGLACPVVMVHGNHEGFAHLETLFPEKIPDSFVPLSDLPKVDTLGRIQFLPPGWRTVTPSGLTVAGVGGIEPGQRLASYSPLAYLDDRAISHLLDQESVDVLLTHQGPTGVQGDHGSAALQLLLEAGRARLWFHGHSTPHPDPVGAGPAQQTLVVPLGDIAFPGKGPRVGQPGDEGWALVYPGGRAEKVAPGFLRSYHKRRWTATREGLLLCPPLVQVAWGQGWL